MSTFSSDQVSLISQDNYYRPLAELPREPDDLVNFDHPDTVDLDRLVVDLRRLQRGEVLQMPEYTFNNPDKVPKTLVIKPAPLLIVEGLFVFYHPALAQRLDLRVFVDAAEHIRLARRLKRDTTERGFTMDSVLRDYERFVAPMYERYVLPTREQADLIIPNHKHMYKALQVLVNHLHAVIKPNAASEV